MADKLAAFGLGDEKAFPGILDLGAEERGCMPFCGDFRHLVTAELRVVGRMPDLREKSRDGGLLARPGAADFNRHGSNVPLAMAASSLSTAAASFSSMTCRY